MTNYGIKISQPGQDVASATDKELVLSSKFNTLKIFMSGYGNAFGGDTVTVAHGLGYVPAFLVLTEIDDSQGSNGEFSPAPFIYPSGGSDFNIHAWTDSTNLNIQFQPDLNGPNTDNSVDYKYVIYLNKGSN